MTDGYALRYLGGVMGWTFEEENRETTWLRMISDFKYDAYRDFWAGSRFVEALLNWLQQFDPADRPAAYKFIRERLVFISFTEMQHLVNRTFPVHIRAHLIGRVAAKLGMPKYLVCANPDAQKLYQEILKRTLFVALSDGARIDGFRRANAGIVDNEQVIGGYEVSDEKWTDVHEELQKRTGDPNARFELVFLIDDFVGSGKTLLRVERGKWKGKLPKIAKTIDRQGRLFTRDYDVVVHHYIATNKATSDIAQLLARASTPQTWQTRLAWLTGRSIGPRPWFPRQPILSNDLLLPESIVVRLGGDPALDRIVSGYYDANIETKSIKVGGTDAKYGFAQCGLPVVLEHNTPNNSLALLWAESPAGKTPQGRPMLPLFRRRQRHL